MVKNKIQLTSIIKGWFRQDHPIFHQPLILLVRAIWPSAVAVRESTHPMPISKTFFSFNTSLTKAGAVRMRSAARALPLDCGTVETGYNVALCPSIKWLYIQISVRYGQPTTIYSAKALYKRWLYIRFLLSLNDILVILFIHLFDDASNPSRLFSFGWIW